jgi:iron only hydrogenase large subunit-like protein
LSNQYFHSVILDKDKCKGCTNCLKRCPTEAIRIRNGKAKIIKERCIDCGECIRICPYHAKSAVTDALKDMERFKYNVALPAPSFYVQFKKLSDVNVILTALKKIGFDDVFEVAKAAEFITKATRKLMDEENLERPLISSACPAVVRLIKIRFPDLINHLVPLLAPVELAAAIAKENAIMKTGLKPDEIGIFFITPCAAKVTAIHNPAGVESSLIDCAVPSTEVYKIILPYIKKEDVPEVLSEASQEGINWATNGGESAGLGERKSIYVDGIHNVIQILEKIENETIEDVDFVEACSCIGGCVGGPLHVENPFVSKSRLSNVLDKTQQAKTDDAFDDEMFNASKWSVSVQYNSVMRLDNDMLKAMEMMEELDRIDASLPGLDCGSCGAPSCRALAEDIVRGKAKESSCIFKLRERVKSLADEIVTLESYAYGQGNKENKEGKDEIK